MPSLPLELLRLVCLHLSPAPRTLQDGLVLRSDYAAIYDDIKTLLKLAACCRSLRQVALSELVWQRHSHGTWLFGHSRKIESTAFSEYKRRALKDTGVRKLVQGLATSVVEGPLPTYARLDALVDSRPDEVWEELERCIEMDPNLAARPANFLGVAHAAVSCRQHLREFRALAIWEHIGAVGLAGPNYTPDFNRHLLGEDDVSFSELAQLLEEGCGTAFSHLSLFDTSTSFLSLQATMDKAVQAAMEPGPDIFEWSSHTKLSYCVELVHRVLHDEMGIRLRVESPASVEGKMKEVMLGYLGDYYRASTPDRDDGDLAVNPSVLALLFAFVGRRLPIQLGFRCLPLSMHAEGFVAICDGRAGEVFFCDMLDWCPRQPPLLGKDDFLKTPRVVDVLSRFTPHIVSAPLPVTIAVVLHAAPLAAIADQANAEDTNMLLSHSLIRAGSLAQIALNAHSPTALVSLERTRNSVSMHLDMSSTTWGQTLAVGEYFMGLLASGYGPADWSPEAMAKKAAISEQLAEGRTALVETWVSRRGGGLVDPLLKVGFVGVHEEIDGGGGKIYLILGWTRDDFDYPASLRYSVATPDHGEIAILGPEVAALLRPLEDVCTPEVVADYLLNLDVGVLAGAFAGFELNSFEPVDGAKLARARGLRFVPSARLLSEFPDDF